MGVVAHVAIALALLCGASGCVDSLERATAEMLRQNRRAAEILRNRSDADSLAAAALVTVRRDAADAGALIARATAAAPERPDLVLLEARICAATAGCDPGPIETRLRELDPANGIGSFGALERAVEAGDVTALDAALSAASRSERIDSYYTTLAARLSVATAQAGAATMDEAVGMVVGELVLIALPGYSAATKSCGMETIQLPGRRDTCRSLAAALMAGDTFIAEMVGIAIAKRAWPVDSPEWKAAIEARRVYQYRTDALMSTYTREWDEAMNAEYIRLAAQHRREQDMTVAQLTALGIDLMPPAGWVDERDTSNAPPQ